MPISTCVKPGESGGSCQMTIGRPQYCRSVGSFSSLLESTTTVGRRVLNAAVASGADGCDADRKGSGCAVGRARAGCAKHRLRVRMFADGDGAVAAATAPLG